MSKSGSGLGKSLKGLNSSTNASSQALEDSIINQISNGSIALTNINITGGTLDGVVVGNDTAGPVYATTIQAGTNDGSGYDVIFYGDSLGEYAQWDSTLGIWIVNGDLDINGTSNLGNITISGNTVSTSNNNGDIIINPNGTGGVVITGDFNQNTTTGDISFQTSDGLFSTTVNENISFVSTGGEFNVTTNQDQNIVSNDGDIIIQSGASKTVYGITTITTGPQPRITTSVDHGLVVGDSLEFVLTNSTPNINGTYSVIEIVDADTFKIQSIAPITVAGTSGSFTKNLDIYLSADTSVNIPYDVKLTFGADTNYLIASSSTLDEMTLASADDINITPGSGKDINIPDNVGITLGSDLRKIESDGSDINIISDGDLSITTTNTVLNSNLEVTGDVVIFNDPILKVNAETPISNDLKDRGIEFNYYESTAKLGFFGFDNTDDTFTYFTDATNTGEVISGTLGNAKFADGSFTSLNLNGGTIGAGQIDVCNINCSGLMTLTGSLGIKLNAPSGQNVIIPQGTFLKFGETGSPSTVIYKEPSGDDLIVQSQGHVFLTPGSTSYDVIVPQGSAVVFNGESGSQKIESTSNIELTVSSSSFLNLTQTSGGVRLTEGLPLIFNQDETTKITGDSGGNIIVNAAQNVNLIPLGGDVTLPVNKDIQFGEPTTYIGSSGAGNLVLVSSTSTSSSSTGNNSIISNTGDIYLTPSGINKSVILPANKSILLGPSGGEYIKSDSSNNIIIASGGSATINSTGDVAINSSTGNISLSPNGYVNIPYTKPLRFGSINENITGTSGNLTLNATNSNIQGNLVVNGETTTINSTVVTIDDPILTLGGDTAPISDDNKDRGIEFRYYNGSAKLGYFGYDDTDGYFTYIPDATNNSEVISGALGNAKFAIGSFTTLNLNDGNLTNVNTISGSTGNDLTIQPSAGQDLILNVDSGANISIPPNVDLLFDGEDAKFYSDGTDLHVDVADPGRFLIDTNTVIDGDLTITGNVNIVGGNTVNLTVERFSIIGGGSQSPNGSSNITFISVSSSGIASGTCTGASSDGFIKNICISSLATGSTYELIFPTGRLLNAGTGSTIATKMIFDTNGMGVQLVWDNSLGAYIVTQGGGRLVLL